jgi:hypothetical protein
VNLTEGKGGGKGVVGGNGVWEDSEGSAGEKGGRGPGEEGVSLGQRSSLLEGRRATPAAVGRVGEQRENAPSPPERGARPPVRSSTSSFRSERRG